MNVLKNIDINHWLLLPLSGYLIASSYFQKSIVVSFFSKHLYVESLETKLIQFLWCDVFYEQFGRTTILECSNLGRRAKKYMCLWNQVQIFSGSLALFLLFVFSFVFLSMLQFLISIGVSNIFSCGCCHRWLNE